MPTFQTPEPITAVIEVVAGTVRVTATDRDDTAVDVRPHDPSRASDVRAAEQARVDFGHGTLTVSAGRRFVSLGRGGAVDIDIQLPSGSRLKASSASADVRADGVFADCRFSSASGKLQVDSVTGNVKADTASGATTVHQARGNVSISTASGNATIDQLEGDLKFQAASANLVIGTLRGAVKSQSASGGVSVATAVNGTISADTSSGEVEVGIAMGTAARLDLETRSGVVSNGLQASDGPEDGDETLVVRARTASGDIDVRRAAGPAAA
ncbi:DUF4097 family beta strand repeat-containing protein [Mycobacterium sp. URHB0044]|jgi:DUF4097 and DUF4098 domain-containing protein YvlB|uniref:DUF4097 family beta strand repeat-containing protein n=1 Tax=Mycobacterium sp. URHB0044 TaxID=1380386 RepID=UPI00048AD601|nr:DUF4097 family beta strand repeat-containing protein [Mycobacterium sp. URHB0044]